MAHIQKHHIVKQRKSLGHEWRLHEQALDLALLVEPVGAVEQIREFEVWLLGFNFFEQAEELEGLGLVEVYCAV